MWAAAGWDMHAAAPASHREGKNKTTRFTKLMTQTCVGREEGTYTRRISLCVMHVLPPTGLSTLHNENGAKTAAVAGKSAAGVLSGSGSCTLSPLTAYSTPLCMQSSHFYGSRQHQPPHTGPASSRQKFARTRAGCNAAIHAPLHLAPPARIIHQYSQPACPRCLRGVRPRSCSPPGFDPARPRHPP